MENGKHPDATETLASEQDTADLADAAGQLTALAAERDQLAAEKAELQDRLLRRQAEFDNYRKRVDRERGELLEYAGMDTVRALLPVLDDFDRALKLESADKDFQKGTELIAQRLRETLQKLGLEPIITAGQTFDPNLHHAVEMFQSEDHDDHSILEEYQTGYNFRGRLLRPSMVKVAVRP